MSDTFGNSTLYRFGAFAPTEISKVNLTGTLTSVDGRYYRYDNLVILTGVITGYSVTSGATRTFLEIDLPFTLMDNAEAAYGSATITEDASPFELVPAGIRDLDGSSNDGVAILFQSTFTGACTIGYNIWYWTAAA